MQTTIRISFAWLGMIPEFYDEYTSECKKYLGETNVSATSKNSVAVLVVDSSGGPRDGFWELFSCSRLNNFS